MNKTPCVYILFNTINGTLYVGVTSNLINRINEHKFEIHKSFTKKYGVNKLGYYEFYSTMEQAIRREKQIKGYKRYKKIKLIEELNPEWRDLSERRNNDNK